MKAVCKALENKRLILAIGFIEYNKFFIMFGNAPFGLNFATFIKSFILLCLPGFPSF